MMKNKLQEINKNKKINPIIKQDIKNKQQILTQNKIVKK